MLRLCIHLQCQTNIQDFRGNSFLNIEVKCENNLKNIISKSKPMPAFVVISKPSQICDGESCICGDSS